MSKKPTYEELEARVRELKENEAKRILTMEKLGEKAKNVCLETGQNPIGDQLKWSKYMLQTILNAIPSSVFWKNSDLRYVGGNRAFIESTGIDSEEDIVGKNDYDLPWQPEQADTFRKDDKEVMESGIAKYNIVETYPKPNGAKGWVRTNKVPLIDGAGDVVGILGTAEEISDLKQQEEKLKQTAQRLTQAHRIGKIGFIEWSIKTDRMYWSDEIYHLYGIDPQVIPTIAHLWHFVHPDDLEYVKKNYELAACGEKKYNIDHRIIRDDNGNVIWVHAQAKAEIDDNGDLESISATVVDITKRKEAEEELLKSQKRLVEAERIGQIGNWSYEVATGKIEWSPGMHLIYGRDPKTDTVSYESLLGFIHPADRDYHNKYFERMLTLKPCDRLEHLEYRLIRPDGEERWVDVCFECEFNDKSKPVLFFGTVIDITERKQAEVNLRESEAKYRHLFSTMTQGVVIQDADGKIIEANQAACNILGLTLDQMYGKTAYDSRWKLIHEDGSLFDPTEVPSNISLRTGKPSNNVICGIYVPEVDKYRWTLISSVPRFQAGEPKPFVTITVFTDITERKKLETQMLQAQKLESIGTLAGGIAHDFNNILSSIIGFTELALDEVKKDTTLDDSLQEVYRAGNRAKDLVKQILAFARQSEEKLKPIQPGLIAKEVLKFIRSTIPTTIEIKQSLDSDSLIMGNATQVHQVLMNLCTNAAHAMKDQGGMLEVSLKDVTADWIIGTNKANLKHNDYIELMVSDTGEGIAPDIISSIFEPYFTTKDPGEGTGMGLAMVLGIVDTYGGHISVDSKMGKGSIFKLYFPITRKRKAQRVYVQKELSRGTERVLFVDDEAPIIKIGSRILERLGYAVTTRTCSIEAMELLRSKPNVFDLVVTDMTMPNITGDQLAIELLKIRPDIPIILCTGYSNKISEETALEIGIKAFVYKPIVKADLAQTVRKVLDEAIF